MTCQRPVFTVVLAAFAGVSCLMGVASLTGCGGSSSETPPPLEPDPRGFHYASAVVPASDSDAGDVPAPSTVSTDDDKPRPKSSTTWGEPSSLPK